MLMLRFRQVNMSANLLFPSDFTETHSIDREALPEAIQRFQADMQTGVVKVQAPTWPVHYLLFVRGGLVNVYRCGEKMDRIGAGDWLQNLNESSPSARLNTLALTPQAVRLVKILVEQDEIPLQALPKETSLQEHIERLMKYPAPALVHITWPGANGLALFPGLGKAARYTLFISPDQVFHSPGSMGVLYGWPEACTSVRLLTSNALTPAWTEYLLHFSFSAMVGHLLERLAEISDRILLSTIIRDINFTTAAHGWNISIATNSIVDQAVFSTPEEAAEVYSRLLELIFHHVDSVVGANMVAVLLRESAMRLSPLCRNVMQEHLLITPVS